jgi:hypothetical protein
MQILKISYKGTDTWAIYQQGDKAKLLYSHPGTYRGHWWDIEDWYVFPTQYYSIEEISEAELDRLKAEEV